MDLPERKSQTLIRAIIKFNKNLDELQTKHEKVSGKILDLSLQLLTAKQTKIETAKELEDLKYEMDNNILLNLEIAFETIGGFELDIVDIDEYLPNIKDEQELLKDLELSVKNLVKTTTVADDVLNKQEKENFNFLHKSYKKLITKTQIGIKEIKQILTIQLQKVKKMEGI